MVVFKRIFSFLLGRIGIIYLGRLIILFSFFNFIMGKLGFWLFFIFIRLMDIFVGVILLVIIIDLLVGGSVLFWGVDGGI